VSAPPAPHDYYVAASRFVPYKRIELIVEAFRHLPDRRLVVVGDGPRARVIRNAAGPNATFTGEVSRERLRSLLSQARAFVFAAEEDFGILPVEAQAAGTPVIALGRGGALETVRDVTAARPTGVLFDEQNGDAIVDAVRRFEAHAGLISRAACRDNAQRFGVARFRREFRAFVAARWDEHVRVANASRAG
jgi:glycosyltransferase involved in cell wall biosynthesis